MPGCAEVLAVRHVLKAIGPDMVLAMAHRMYGNHLFSVPLDLMEHSWIHIAFENAAAVASGVESGLKALRRKGRIPNKDVTVVAMGGDGGTSDIEFQALSGMLERGPQGHLRVRR